MQIRDLKTLALGLGLVLLAACSESGSGLNVVFDGGAGFSGADAGGGGGAGTGGGAGIGGGAGGAGGTAGTGGGGTGGTGGAATGGTGGGGTGGTGGIAGKGGASGGSGGTAGTAGAGGMSIPASVGVGRACASDQACDPGITCLDEGEGWPSSGYCSAQCAADADCGQDAFCAPQVGGVRICVKRCAAGKTCSEAGRVCSRTLAGLINLGQDACVPGKGDARDGDACSGLDQCRGNQICLRNPFSLPTGMCAAVGCTPGNHATCAATGDGACLPLGNTGICVDRCTQPSDCRTNEGHTCVATSATGPMICVFDVPGPGKPCEKDSDCGPSPWECLKGTAFPNGYCSARACDPDIDETCPFDATCFDPNPQVVNDHYCVARCTSNLQCAAGYLCEPLSQANTNQRGCVKDPR